MKKIYSTFNTLALSILVSTSVFGQGQPNNAGFENWQNVGSSTEEPTNWNGMMTGNLCGFCGLGASQRVFRDGTVKHSGNYSARIESTTYLGNIVNGNITTGQVTAPSTTPSQGYNVTLQSNANFNHPFTSKPDSVVIWAKYNQTTSVDSARISVTLHDAYDVRDPANAASGPYIVARAVKNFQTNGTTNWVRISVPFDYNSYPATNVAYMLASITPSKTAGQGSGSSKLWVDDMEFIYNPPVAGFTASAATICAGTQIDFTNTTTSGTSTTYSWDFGDGNNSTATSPSHTYASAGNYTVTLTSTNVGGSDVETMSITVNAAPNVVASGTTSVCLGSSVTISASGATSFTWDNGLGAGASHNVSPTINTTYTVTGTTSGCSAQDQITITVETPLSAGTANALTECAATTSVDLFTGLTGEDTGGTWADDNNTGALSGNIFNPSIIGAGTYNFTYTQPATATCPASSTTTTVTVTNSVNAGSPSGVNTVCPTVASFDLFSSITGYTSGGNWNDDNNTGALTGSSFNASSVIPGAYSFTYSFAPGSCGSDTETILITVLTPPAVSAGGDIAICIGDVATIMATGASTYSWDNGLGTGSTQTVSPVTTTTYVVVGTDLNGCTNSDDVMVTVNALPLVDAGVDQTVCDGSQVTLSGSGATTYDWNNGIFNGVAFTPSLGTTTYTVTGTDVNGCVNTDNVDVIVNALPTVTLAAFSVSTICTYNSPISLPTGTPVGGIYTGSGVSGGMFDPSGLTAGTYTVTYDYTDNNGCSNSATSDITVSDCLGLDELSTQFTIYPNPAKNELNVVTTSTETVFILLIDGAGRIITESSFNGATRIDVSGMENGTYFLKLVDTNGRSSIEKVTIIK